jgi:hydroxymethylpyrimidine/phosphomethylpyrimidine kinase
MYGEPLLDDAAMDAIRTRLFPRAALATPNLDEVRLLVGVTVTDEATAREAATALHALGARWVLVKGGHLHGSPQVTDLLSDGEHTWSFDGPRIDTPDVHGAGDALASAICAGLARGLAMPDAVAMAERYIRRAVAASYPLGAGTGPVSPLWAVREWWTETS